MPNSISCYMPVGAVSQTSMGSSTAVTVTQKPGSTAVMVQVVTNNVYWTFDGSTPSATNGMTLIAATNPFTVPIGAGGSTGLTHKFLASTGTAVVNFQSLGG